MRVGAYDLYETIGTGSYGKVKVGKHSETGQKVAVKIMKKGDLENSKLKVIKREIQTLRMVDHPCVTKLIEALQTSEWILIVMEYMDGGDLFHYMRKHGVGGLPVAKAFNFFYQIQSSLEHCQAMGICHRDIKAENILLDAAAEKCKIADFGMACKQEECALLETSCGSPHYAAPEVIRGQKYDGTKSDVWSLGVLLYGLCAGYLPFNDNNVRRLLDKVCEGHITFPEHFSEDLRDLISRMLTKDANKRISMAEIRQHQWWMDQCHAQKLDPRGLHDRYKSDNLRVSLDEEGGISSAESEGDSPSNGLHSSVVELVDKTVKLPSLPPTPNGRDRRRSSIFSRVSPHRSSIVVNPEDGAFPPTQAQTPPSPGATHSRERRPSGNMKRVMSKLLSREKSSPGSTH
jgi:serine/threonine protein kinase